MYNIYLSCDVLRKKRQPSSDYGFLTLFLLFNYNSVEM